MAKGFAPPAADKNANEVKAANAASAARQKPVESREESFKRLAAKRVPRAIKAILAVGKLGSRKPNRERIDRVEAALVRALDQCVADLRRANVSAPMLFDVDA